MKHQKLRRRLSLYLDGQTSTEETQAVERHLSECATCANELQRLRSIRRALLDLELPTVRPFFAQRVLAEFDAQSRMHFWSFFEWVPRPLLYAGLTAAVAVLCLFTAPTLQTQKSTLSQLYADQSLTIPETDDQTLAFALQRGDQELNGE